MEPRRTLTLYHRGKTWYGWHKYVSANAKRATLLLHKNQYEKLYGPDIVTVVIITGDVASQL